MSSECASDDESCMSLCSDDDGDNEHDGLVSSSRGGSHHSAWFSSMLDETQCFACGSNYDEPTGEGAAFGGAAAAGGWFSSSMASYGDDMASVQAASSALAPATPVAIAVPRLAAGGNHSRRGSQILSYRFCARRRGTLPHRLASEIDG
eukprot:scaffold3341_cov153-Isochrysis_galbana.AAC.4